MGNGRYDVIITGAGPAGIFAALELIGAKPGWRILILEKGRDIQDRSCPIKIHNVSCVDCSPCSTLCGWGGAGAFSDGKLTLSSEVGGLLGDYIGKGRLVELIRYVDDQYLHFGGPHKVYGLDRLQEIEEIRRKAVLAELKLIPAPIRHLGTGRCQQILEAMQSYLLERGLEYKPLEPVREIRGVDGCVHGVVTDKGFYEARYVIAAPGREGSEWLMGEARRLGLTMAINPVDIGVRVELPAAVLDPITDVVYESKFVYSSRTFQDRVRTFCMNPNGEVVMENNEGLVTVNGHSHAEKKTANTNFAVLVSKNFTEPFKEPIAYGKYVSRLANLLGETVIVQRLGDLIDGHRSTEERLRRSVCSPTLPEATPGDLSLVLPYRHLTSILEMLQAMDKVAPGVYSRHTLLYGVEVKFYSSRLALSGNLETQVQNLFAAGDGAGVTRGLAQASAAGVVAAREIIARG